MKTTKTMAIVLATAIIVTAISSTYAMGNGQGTWSGSTSNMIDTNYNQIADWQEDFDNDGILNKDDSDYVKTLDNMKDDDLDGVPNKDDSDYEKSSNWTWTLKQNTNWTWALKSKTDRTQELKTKLWKNAWAVDTFISKAEKTYSNLSLDEQKIKYENLIKKVDNAVIKVEKLKITDEKKQSYKDLLEYLKIQTQSKIDSLDIADLD